jgi:GT2 family glycosyltransferase
MKLSIIIISWNVRKELLDCIGSIRNNPPSCHFEIIVVDNASIDDTIEAVKSNFPEVELIINETNRGFAVANNLGIQKTRGQYILFLNPDTIVHPHSLDILINFMDKNKDAGVCGPKLLNFDGSLQESIREFPTFRAALHRHTAFRYLYIFKWMYKKWAMKEHDDKQMDVDQVMGAALMTRKSIIEQVGPMDEQFFMYYEEVDLCYRIKTAGWHIVYVPESEITHIGGCSSGQIPAEKRIMALTSLLKFFKKHRGAYSTALFVLLFKPALVLRDIIEVSSGMIKYISWTLMFNKNQRVKSAQKIKQTFKLLSKYSWLSLFRV